MKKNGFLVRLSGLLAIMILAIVACSPMQSGNNAVKHVLENGVETYEYNGETLAMEFPHAATEQAKQFVTNLFDKRFDYAKIYEKDTELEKVLTSCFGELLHKERTPVNNKFESNEVDQMITYQFKGLYITYYVTSQGKKIFEKLEVTGELATPLIYDIKIGMKTADLIGKLGQPVARQQDSLYYGHMDEAGLYYEGQVMVANNQITRIVLRIAGGV